MKTRLMSTRYSGTRLGSTSRPASSATYQLRWTESRKSPRSCAYEVLKTKRTESDLLAAHRAEHALGPHGQHEQQHDVRSDVLESLREIDAGEQLDEPDGHAADQRARDRSEAAQHRSRERLEADEAEVDVDQRHGRQQHTGDRGDRGDGSEERQPVADAVPDHEHVARERAQHEEVALGEVHELGRLVDEDEAESDQAVDAAHGQAIQDELQDGVQADVLRAWAASSEATRRALVP